MALRLAYQRPDLVAGLVLIEGGPGESAVSEGMNKSMGRAGFIKLVINIQAHIDRLTKQLRACSGAA